MFNEIKKLNTKICEKRRFNRTVKFLKKTLPLKSKILDLGIPNKLSKRMIKEGFYVSNTGGEDFDINPIIKNSKNYDVVTAFEILEHLVNPFELLKNLKSKKLFATIPLNLWFCSAYRNMNDIRDQHFHEFEDWQFDWLLDKSGWKIIRKEKWKSPTIIPGFRFFLRHLTYRYYAIEAIRK